MLVQLSIRDIVLIDKLDLEFGPGFSILTGETGAGKSILLDGLALALGARGDGGLVRHGAAQGQVTAVFELAAGHPALLAANTQGMDLSGAGGTVILRRVQLADGRSRAFINDQRVTTQALRAAARELVEIHGQHDDRAFVSSSTHRELLDAFGGLRDRVEGLRVAYARVRALRAEQAAEEARCTKAQGEAGYLRHAFAELTELAPRAGEETTLAERRSAMMQAEKVAAELSAAYAAVAGEQSPVPSLSAVLRRLQRREAQAPDLIGPASAALDSALNALDHAGLALEEALRASDFEPRELEKAEERLFALRAAARKYGLPVDELPQLAQKFAADLESIDAGVARLDHLTRELAAAQSAYAAAARALSATRRQAASRLDAAVNAELAPLRLEGARFHTELRAAGEGPEGFDEVEFWVQTNPGTKPGPLTKIASGGELARFLLALKVVLAGGGSAPTLIFDEIDSGAGGATADAIGQRLARLASRVQVLAVTHAPQVAARASRHFRIVKDAAQESKAVRTRVAVLEPGARREEIARMLAGAIVTSEARAAAARLLEGAG
jgi:DNA repair protein RecN (Recombination protein N)